MEEVPFYKNQKVIGSDKVMLGSKVKQGQIYTIKTCIQKMCNGLGPFWYIGIRELPECGDSLGLHLVTRIIKRLKKRLPRKEKKRLKKLSPGCSNKYNSGLISVWDYYKITEFNLL